MSPMGKEFVEVYHCNVADRWGRNLSRCTTALLPIRKEFVEVYHGNVADGEGICRGIPL